LPPGSSFSFISFISSCLGILTCNEFIDHSRIVY
jgi:hypothetical protein